MASGTARAIKTKLGKKPSRLGTVIFAALMLVGLVYTATHLAADLELVRNAPILSFLLLGGALLIALGFEFVNGFHDTANSVATVIYTHSMDPHMAVVWSGVWNFVGAITSTGAVAFGVISLLPVELILKVGTGAGWAMVFALLAAATLWNVGTWYFGLPSSSTHTMVGSIVGVGVANQLMSVKTGTSGVDWTQAAAVGRSLFIFPVLGFVCAGLLLGISKAVIKDRHLYEAPESDEPPPFWIRVLLVGTCTGVSFAHGSNGGQKGMGLIMLILIGTVPGVYALNRAVPEEQTAEFLAVSQQADDVVNTHIDPGASSGDPRDDLTEYIETRNFDKDTMLALRSMIGNIGNEVAVYQRPDNVPPEQMSGFRTDMYVVSEALRLVQESGRKNFSGDDLQVLANYKKHIDLNTKFIPSWVKVAVAMALGLGTMVGWKRIVVTVGEKIGKQHLTFAQGAAAEITAMATIGTADYLGLPVSTTHVLASGIGGTMTANGSGLHWETVRNMLITWALTLPASFVLSGFLFWAFHRTF